MKRSLKKGRARRARLKRWRRAYRQLGSIVPVVLRSMVFDPFAAMLREALLGSARVPANLLSFAHGGLVGERRYGVVPTRAVTRADGSQVRIVEPDPNRRDEASEAFIRSIRRRDRLGG